MFKIQINDGFNEWTYHITGRTDLSSYDLARAIADATGMKIVERKFTGPGDEDILEATRTEWKKEDEK